jgi:hypothetical protein
MSNRAANKTVVRAIVIGSIAISIVTCFLALGLPDGKPLMLAALLNGLIGLGVLFRDPAVALFARIGGAGRGSRSTSAV